MAKDPSIIIKVCDSVVKYSMYALVFFIPLFFLPWTLDIVDFNKQALLVVLSLVALFAWMVKTLVTGRLTLRPSKVHFAIVLLVLAYLVSTIFSVSKYASFWGSSQVISESFLSVLSLCIMYFLVSTVFSKKELSISLQLFGVSALLAQLFGVLQLFGWYLIPLDITRTGSFNTISQVGTLGFFAAALLPFWIVSMMAGSSPAKKVLAGANVALAFLLILVINYNFVWWIVFAGAAVALALSMVRKESFGGRWMFLPMFFFVIALFFIMLHPQIGWLPQSPVEVFLSTKANATIDVGAIKSMPILGSGPGTFLYDFSKYKDPSFNQSNLWNISFGLGSSRVLTGIATVGILGVVALLLMIVVPLWSGFSAFFARRANQIAKDDVYTALGLILTIASLAAGFFLYNSSIVLDVTYFLMIGFLVVLTGKETKTYVLESATLLTLATTFIFTLVFIFGVGFLILETQRYVAEVQYHQAVLAFSNNQKPEAIAHIKSAANDNPNNETYFTQLAVFSLSELQDEISAASSGGTTSDDQKKNLQTLISDAINAATIATNINPNSPDTWSTKAYVCQNLIGLVSDAPDCTIQSYDKAIALSPLNPYLLVQEGNAYLQQTVGLSKDDAAKKSQLLINAGQKYDLALALKNDYAAAWLQKAVVAQISGDNSGQATALDNADKYSADDASMALQIGLAYYQDQQWDKAQGEFLRALAMVPNYSNALYYSGLTYDKQGKKDAAVATFAALVKLNPGVQNLQKILDNLKAGKPALDGLVQQTPSQPETAPATPPVSDTSANQPPEKLKNIDIKKK